MADDREILNRWRLMLGRHAQGQISFSENNLRFMEMEEVLEYLYEREYGEEQEIRKERQGGREDSSLTVPSWIEKLRKLFLKQTVEIMERHEL